MDLRKAAAAMLMMVSFDIESEPAGSVSVI
jgi:hypothetical protein